MDLRSEVAGLDRRVWQLPSLCGDVVVPGRDDCFHSKEEKMKATPLYRFVAIVFVLFAVGHTFGFLNFKAPTPEGRAVFDSMNAVQIPVRGDVYTYGNFYRGFGLIISINMVFSAILAWWLGQVARTQTKILIPIAWAFAATQVVGVLLSVEYFSVLPAVFSVTTAAGLVWAACLL
jgi:hypothetical protein